jgi:D-alanine-D-alanine ligase
MSNKLRAAILFGGKSAEHEISLISAMNIIAALDRSKYEAVLIGIDKTGRWFLQDEAAYMQKAADPRTITLTDFSEPLALLPGSQEPKLLRIRTGEHLAPIHVVFPILHGPYGEDGTMQGLLRHLDLPFVGPGVLGSSVSMDKEFTKRMLTHAGIPNAKYRVFHRHERGEVKFDEIAAELGLPVYIKPANLGSSVGVSRASNREEFEAAIDLAFRFDLKLLIEESLKGREIECAVLGNEYPEGSVPGEVIPKDGFYSYEAKYLDEKGAALEMPARNLTDAQVATIRETAVRAYKALACEGLTRVDFFLLPDGRLYINEVNTLPGFTKISMYPKLWELSGIPYPQLVDKLLQLAIHRHEQEKALSTSMEFV